MLSINTDYYIGEDLYSDGDIEDELLQIVQQQSDFNQVILNDDRWPILYHLSPIRRNLLEWFPFNPSSSLLEVGAGCGALTGLFCEKVHSVTAVEISKRRAEIVANRHSSKKNLEIIVGDLNHIQFNKKFEYITLIGVLEYAGKFGDSEQPYADLIKTLRQLLTPNGVLFVAIENKFGLKYWAGANEDHTCRLYDGIEGYPTSKDIMTFGKRELEELLGSAFTKLKFYYPVPDYKMPQQLFSDDYPPKVGQISGYAPNYDQNRITLFDEQLVTDNLILNDHFDFFANSFLVVAEI
jgi:Dimethyladenosine transferase (rRNA methylation)